MASRLSFGLWDSIPDATLLQAAASGRLATREQVTREAERMVSDLRTRAKVRDFFLQWLKVDPVPDLSKDPKLFPGFTPEVASDLRTSLDLFLEDVIWSERVGFSPGAARRFPLSQRTPGPVLWRRPCRRDAPFQKVSLDPGARAGVLSHPYLMATFAYAASSSPIHRGVFISRNVLGRSLRPPPAAQVPLAPELHPELTTRERVTLQTSPASCTTCHGMINPLGFALENFDAVGRYRKAENGTSDRRDRYLRAAVRHTGCVQRSAGAGKTPGRQPGDACGLRRAAFPLPGQAADPRLRARCIPDFCDRSPRAISTFAS